MIWVYGICDRPDLPLPRRRGLAQAPLDSVRADALLAVISRHVHPPSEPALDSLWVHERVVERLMAERAVLPMRFGSKVDDDEALTAVLEVRQRAFLAALDRVRGRVELGVRVLRSSAGGNGSAMAAVPAATPPATGRDYLLGKLQEGKRVDKTAAAIHDPLAALAVDSRRQPQRSADELLRASYLVERGGIARFRSAVDRLQTAHPGAAILCTGPWPTYSFVEDPTRLAATAGTPTIGTR
jgi:hypothetical protein